MRIDESELDRVFKKNTKHKKQKHPEQCHLAQEHCNYYYYFILLKVNSGVRSINTAILIYDTELEWL